MNEQQFEQAIRSYWTVREAQAAKQLASGRTDAGLRGQATGGAHLDAIAMLLEEVFTNAGFPLDHPVPNQAGNVGGGARAERQ